MPQAPSLPQTAAVAPAARSASAGFSREPAAPGSGREDRRPPLVDAGVVQGIRQLEHRLGKSVLPEMFEILERHVPSSFGRMRTALADGNADALRHLSHKLKSSARCLGLLRLSESCGALEGSAARGCLVGGVARLAAIEQEYGRAAEALKRYLAQG